RTTLEIAERCNVELELGQILLPEYPTPDGRDSFEYLLELTERGLEKRYGHATPDLNDRLKFELKTIKEMGFVDYFLIVWDFISFAKRNGISVGPGRGSTAGSLVAYCREIVDLAKPLEGLTRQDSIHAAGVVIGAQPLIEVVPLQQKGSDQEVVTQFAMGDVEALGLLKIDFLGLRNLDVLEKARELVGNG